jgi:hypothetical protein
MALLGGSRHISPRFPHTTTTPIGAYVHSIFADVLDGKEQQPEKLSPAQIWAERSAKLDLPPPPDTWTGRYLTWVKQCVVILTVRCRQEDTC